VRIWVRARGKKRTSWQGAVSAERTALQRTERADGEGAQDGTNYEGGAVQVRLAHVEVPSCLLGPVKELV
jgi:hypothetical protein